MRGSLLVDQSVHSRPFLGRIGMHEMRTIAADKPVAWWVCQSFCLYVAHLNPAKTAERIQILFGVETPDPKEVDHCIKWGLDPPTVRGFDTAFA